MIGSFLASEEKGKREFIELGKRKMEMENEAARNADRRVFLASHATNHFDGSPAYSSTASRTAPTKQWHVPL